MNVIFGILCVLLIWKFACGEFCDNGSGECRELSARECPVVFENLHLIGPHKVKYCDEFNDIVCCPLPLNMQQTKLVSVDTRKLFERECRHYNDVRPLCRPTPFILGGTRAEAREFPFMALLGTRKPDSSVVSYDCGGTLIHPKFVMTAAHCMETEHSKEDVLNPNFRSTKYVVRLGELDYASEQDDARPQDFTLVNYVTHPSFYEDEDGSPFHDIAVLELDRKAIINEYVAPACLPNSAGDDFPDLQSAGWGYTTSSGNKSSHLLKVSLQRFNLDICQQRLEKRIVAENQFCAGSASSERVADTCNGDSGGPIFVQHPSYNCLKIAIGITSYGLLCGNSKFPSVYTKVHLYTDWIEQIVWGNERA